jgi:hypothetical protein
MNKFLRVVVDRVEGEWAVLVLYDDDNIRFNMPLALLPEGTRGGDHLRVSLEQDLESREREREKAARLLDELRRQRS